MNGSSDEATGGAGAGGAASLLGDDLGGPQDSASSRELLSGVAPPPGRSLRSNLAALATSQLITWVITMAWTLVVPRILGPEVIGLVVIATSVSALVTVGMNFATREFLVREMVSEPAGAGRLVSLALCARGATIPVVLLAAHVYGVLADLDASDMVVVYLTALATCATLLLDVALAAFQSRERMHYIAGLDVGNKSLNTLGAIVLAVAGYGIIAISAFSLAITVLALGVALVGVHRMVGMGARPAPMKSVLSNARPYWLISVLVVAYVWVDGLMLGLLVPGEVVGWYGAATRLFATMGFVAVIVVTATFPRLVAAHAQSPQRMFDVARQPFEWVVMVGLPIGVGMACIAEDLIGFLYGPAFAGSVIPLVLLVLGLPLTYANTLANQMFIASGRPSVTARLLATASGFNILLNLVLIPWTQHRWGNGAIGASASLLLTELLQAILCLTILGRQLVTSQTLRRLGKTALATGGMAAVVLAADEFPWILRAVLGAVVFVVLCILLRVPNPQELAVARAGLARVRRRGPGAAR